MPARRSPGLDCQHGRLSLITTPNRQETINSPRITIANSPLVKGAIRAGVVNWGRIACALGKSAARVDQDKVTLKLGGVTLFARGRPCNPDLTEARRHVTGKEVRIDCNLGIGKGAFCALTCDLPQ